MSRRGGKSAPRVVLDTNGLVFALLFLQGRTAELRGVWPAGRFIPLACRETVEELIRVLGYPKFRLEKADVDILLTEALPWMETHTLAETLDAIPGLRDPADAVFIHLAVQAGADFLVSGNAHILSLGDKAGDARIITPGKFLELLEMPLTEFLLSMPAGPPGEGTP